MESSRVDCETLPEPLNRPRMQHDTFASGIAPVIVSFSRFAGADGTVEFEFFLRPAKHGTIEAQLDWLRRAYDDAIAAQGLAQESGLYRRFYCSDPRNQSGVLETQSFSQPLAGTHCAVSWVGQPPEPPAKVAMWAQHIHDPGAVLDTGKEDGSAALRRGELTHHWTTNVTCTKVHRAYDQTKGIFSAYDAYLGAHGMTLRDHVVRTWFFVRHVDVNYEGLVNARRELFEDRGLTAGTHFIASTGIEGCSALDAAKVSMDAYAIGGLRPEQVTYLEALDHLGPTHVYGVTFERATEVAYRDRKHIFISGTASIDPEGKIMHTGDVSRQLDRVLENVEALLAQSGAGLGDMCAFIAYVRDPSDQSLIRERMAARLGAVPVTVVVAPVCRPGWLIELEGRAIVENNRSELPAF